jgi:DNA ligase (NAD+)
MHGSHDDLVKTYETDMTAVHDLKARLTDAAKAYYQGSDIDSPMTDEEYDAGIKYLRQLDHDYDLKDTAITSLLDGKVAGGTSVEDKNANKVHHDVPMLSLRKADNEEQVQDYLRDMEAEGATGFKLQAKLDGIACSAQYDGGQLVKMSTRGNGSEGEDMSYLISSPDVQVKGLPKQLGGKLSGKSVEIRGELFLRPSEFEKMNAERRASGGDEYKNPRNTNAGIVKRAARGMNGEKATLQFVMYKIVGPTSADDLADAGVAEISRVTEDEWRKTGDAAPASLIVMMKGKTPDEVTADTMNVINMFGPVRDDLDIPTDGIVIKPVNETEMDRKMGHNAHHPLSQLAWKYSGAMAQVKVQDVEWTVGKSGKLTPTVIYEPASFGGSMNSRATLHNPAILEELQISKGSVIQVEKRHDVIPEIKREKPIFTPANTDAIKPPKTCPYCGQTIVRKGRVYSCPNPQCPSRGSYMLKAAAGKGALNFDGMGGNLIESLQDSGAVSTIADFYDLTEDSLAETPVGTREDGTPKTFGHTRAQHVMEFINASKNLPFHKVLPALSINDLGPQTAKAIISKYPSIDEIRSASVDDLASIEGIGPETARKVKDGISAQWPVIQRLKTAGLQMEEKHQPLNHENGSDPAVRAVKGLRFSISGAVPSGYKNRGEWQEFVDAMGGEAQSAPNADTDYMIGDPSSTSGKIMKAKKLGVKIISPDEFMDAVKRGSFTA